MQTASAMFLEAVRYPQKLATEVTLTPPSGAVITLGEVDGAVTIDRTAERRRSLTLTIGDVDLYPFRNSDPLNVYGSVVIVKRGIQWPDGLTEMFELGRFRVNRIARDIPGSPVTIEGWDRSAQMTDARFRLPRKLSGQSALSLLTLLVREVFPTITILDQSNGAAAAETIPQHVVEMDRWPECQRVGQLIGCEVFFNEQGQFVVQPVPDPTTAVPVWDVDASETGVLISASDEVTREGAPNAVIAHGESTASGQQPIHSVYPHGFDTNPSSPTYWGSDAAGTGGSAFGQVPMFYSSGHIKTQTQANRVADAMLADHLGVSRSVSFSSIVNPALDASDAIRIVYPTQRDAAGVEFTRSEVHVIDTLEIPLGSTSAMTGTTRTADLGALS